MLTSLAQEMTGISDLSHEARRFRVVLESFNRNVELLFGHSAISPHVNSVALAEAFSNWKSAFEASRQLAAFNRADFVFCAAGLMLKELFKAHPLADLHGATLEDIPAAAADWPEGYAYVNFCASMAEAVLSGMGVEPKLRQELLDNPEFWQSFRENVKDNVSTAPGFLDLLFGNEPNWNGPDVPTFRPGLLAALGGPQPAKAIG
ncbi:MAG: hypothetical protein KGO53_04190 [Alphaproteobacteria bacterium]|nr:hypothetical protein [Alphaproteobacteria bacterium]